MSLSPLNTTLLHTNSMHHEVDYFILHDDHDATTESDYISKLNSSRPLITAVSKFLQQFLHPSNQPEDHPIIEEHEPIDCSTDN